MNPRIFITPVMIFLLCIQAFSQSSADQVKDLFVNIVKTKGLSVALDSIASTNPKVFSGTAFQKTTESFAEAAKNSGKYIACEELSKKEFGTSIVIYSLLLKYENLPFLISLTVYTPSNSWKAIGVEIEKMNIQDLNKALNTRTPNNRPAQNMRQQQGGNMQQGGTRPQQGTRMNQPTQQQNATE